MVAPWLCGCEKDLTVVYESLYWPLITTDDADGHSGLVVMPRWVTSLYIPSSREICGER